MIAARGAAPAPGRDPSSLFAYGAGGKVTVVGAVMRSSLDGEHPSWSPDGRELVYAKHTAGSSRRGLYIASRDGSGERQIVTHGQDENINDADQFDPAWSPVGDTILYTSTRSGSADVWST